MKKLYLLLLAVALASSPISTIGAESPEYLGEYCWTAQSNSVNDPMSSSLRLGVMSIEGIHFPLYGTLKNNEGSFVVSGTAELIDNGIEASLQGSGITAMFRQMTTMHLQLQPNLDGYYRSLGFEAIGGGQPEFLSDEGTLTLVNCP
jgi:hypothetical protein